MSMSQLKVVPATQPASSSPKNIVIFGKGGVGKSSLINLIAGQTLALTSNGANACTSYHTKHKLLIDDTPYAAWDTAGLDEGTYGTVPAKVVERRLEQLLCDLDKAGGVHLLIYCITGSRILGTSLWNYNLLYSAICRKKVPIVVVATGLEYYGGEMADWWTTNEKKFTALKMHFDGHACVTTLNADEVYSPTLILRCLESRQAVRSLIADTCARDHWGAEQEDWTSAALTDMRGMLKSHYHVRSMTPVVALYHSSLYSPDLTTKNTFPFEGACLMDVNGNPFTVYYIQDENLLAGARFKKQMSLRGADLLIFCASIHDEPGTCLEQAAAFYRSYGGDVRPFLIIIRDALSDEEAHEWWKKTSGDKDGGIDGREHSCHTRKLQAIVRYLPPPESPDVDSAVANIQQAILMRSLIPVDVVPTGFFSWISGWIRRVKSHAGRMNSAQIQEDSLATFKVWVPLPAGGDRV